MSDTDKTKPYWVKLLQNPQWRVVHHNHERHPCDLADENHKRNLWLSRECGYSTSTSARGFYARSKSEQVYRDKTNGHARTTLRSQLRTMMKMSREDLEDGDFQSFPHKHQALWDSE